jgi:large conductance mechanosensitive channel
MDAFDRARDLGVEAFGTVGKRSGKALREFKAFVLRGNVVDLAVGVVVGAAFSAIVNSLVQDLLTPLLGFAKIADFKNAQVCIGGKLVNGACNGGTSLAYGKFVNAIITFVLISAVVFFFVVKPVNHLMARRKTEPDVDTQTRECPECLSKVPVAARRCAFCTSEIGAAK